MTCEVTVGTGTGAGGGAAFELDTDNLDQFVSSGSTDFAAGGGTAGTLSVVATSEHGNVIRYTGGTGTAITEIFMITDVLGFSGIRRHMIIEFEMFTTNFGGNSYIGPFILADADTPLHGFSHLQGTGAARGLCLNNGTVEVDGTTGTLNGTRFLRYHVVGEKPAAAIPHLTSVGMGWGATNSGHEMRRTGSSDANRGTGPRALGNNSSLGSSWNSLDLDRFGICVNSAGGVAPPTSLDIKTFRIWLT